MGKAQKVNRLTKPDLSSVSPFVQLAHVDKNSHLYKTYFSATEYIKFFDWVDEIVSVHIGYFCEGIISIFLFEISTNRDDVDNWLWVLVGDLPPSYITCDVAKNPFEALDAYIGAMEDWVAAAQAGRSVASLIPVNVPATPENAESLQQRLRILDVKILPLLK